MTRSLPQSIVSSLISVLIFLWVDCEIHTINSFFRRRVVVSSSCVCFVVVVVLPPFQLFCSMTAAISLLLSVVYQRVIVKSCDVCFQLPHLPEAALETIISVFSVLVKINCQFLQSCMEHAELSSSVIFVCHVNFSCRLEAESTAFSVLFLLQLGQNKMFSIPYC